MFKAIRNSYFLGWVYIKVQALFVVFQYRLLRFYYSGCACGNFDARSLPSGDIQILYVGGDEFQDKSGFLQALNKVSAVTYFTKNNGEYGSYNEGAFTKKTANLNGQRLEELLKSMAEKPHLLLMQMWGWRISLDSLARIKKRYPEMIIANIAMDDRHSFLFYGSKKKGSAGLIPLLDYVFTTSSEAVQWYQKEGVKAYFYPLASDPSVFFPTDVSKEYDIGFVGANYGVRAKIVQKLADAGFKVKTYGNGWPDGRLDLEQVNDFFNRCRIVLGVNTILGCKTFSSMKLRDFDATMSGAIYLTSYNEDTEKIFSGGDSAYYYKSPEEVVDRVKEILSDERKMLSVSRKAREIALVNTYDIRVNDMLNKMR